MIAITTEAEQRLAQQIAKHPGAIGVRVSIKKTGCSGYMYVFSIQESRIDEDQVIEGDNYTLFIDPKAASMLERSTLKYEKQFLNSVFEFDNPNEAARCGCGESFTL